MTQMRVRGVDENGDFRFLHSLYLPNLHTHGHNLRSSPRVDADGAETETDSETSESRDRVVVVTVSRRDGDVSATNYFYYTVNYVTEMRRSKQCL